jgi:exosortase/archaeosortase family protein
VPAHIARREGLRFCLLFSGFAVAVFSALYAAQDGLVTHVNRHLAWLAERCLGAVGVAATSSGPFVSVRGFGVEIRNNCNAVYEIGLYAAAVWVYPATLREKALGTLVGAGALYLVNAARVLALIGLGVFARDWFDVAHLYAWQLVFLAVVATCWVGWVIRVRPRA